MTPVRLAAGAVIVLGLCRVAGAQAPQAFQFAVSATDASGAPVTDLKPEDVVMSENGVPQQVVKVEPLSVPLKLTLAVDNGVDSSDALVHYRSGLTGLVEALPEGVEITLITIAPQPRMVVRPTTDRAQVLRGINGFAPEQAAPRFTDALVEFSERLQKEAKDRKIAPYVPVMIMLSTTANQQTSYEATDVAKAMNFLVGRRARLNMIVMSTRTGQATSAGSLNASVQSIVGMPVVKATNGRYEALAASSRLATLLPEWGKDLASLQRRQANQFRVTVERAKGGELQNPRVELARPGLEGQVTIDGILP
jgi:hypothetical protein